MDVRIELPVSLDRGDAVPLEQRRERAMDEADALLELRLLVLFRCGECPLEVVEDRQELSEEPRVRELRPARRSAKRDRGRKFRLPPAPHAG